MKDRLPLYPGRVKLVPVSGQENVYDMTRADQPAQEGDPLNKATLLKDTTAELFGLSADAVPDDALAYLGKYAQHWWAKIKKGYKISIGDPKTEFNRGIETGASSDTEEYIEYGDSVTVDDNGNVIIESPSTLRVSYSTYTNFDITKGRYFIDPSDGEVYKNISENGASRYRSGSYFYIQVEAIAKVTTAYNYEVLSYVQSPNEGEYPKFGEKDGYVYQYLGMPFDNSATSVKYTLGYYVGTGKSGTSNPIELTFEFIPKIVIIRENGSSFNHGAVFINGQEVGIADGRGSSISSGQHLYIEWNGNVLKFNNDMNNSPNSMLNALNEYYFYVALG